MRGPGSQKVRSLVGLKICQKAWTLVPGQQREFGPGVQCFANVSGVRHSSVADVLHGCERCGVAELGRDRLDVRPGLHLARRDGAPKKSGRQTDDAIWKCEYGAIAEKPQALPDPLRVRDDPGSLFQI